MKKTSLFILLTCVALLASVAVYAAPRTPQREKARYYYLEGARLQASDRNTEAYEYYKKAYLTDPSYAEAASAYGLYRILVLTDSMQSKGELMNSLSLMRKYVDVYPADLYEARSYAYLAGRIDTIAEAIRIYERLDSLRPSDTSILLQLSDTYMMSHQEDKAIDVLNRFERIEGKSPQLSVKKMSALFTKGDTLGALREVDELIAINPREPDFHILKGNLYEVIGNNDSVLAAYTRAETLNPDYGSAKLSLANYYKHVGDSVAYDKKVYEALLSEDFEMEDKLSLLSEYLQTLLEDASDTARGDHLFSVIMQQYPHEPSVLDLAARYSSAKGNYEEAIQEIGYALDLDPANPMYWQQLMSYQIAADKGKEAMDTFNKASSHIEITDQLRLMYSTAANIAKEYDEAERVIGELIHAYNPNFPLYEPITDIASIQNLSYQDLARISTLYNMLGEVYYSTGDLEKTYGTYDNSLLFNPENALSLNNYAYFLSENDGDLDKAESMARQAVEISPDNETCLDTMAWVLFKKKEYKEALEFQEKALEMAEKNGNSSAEFYNHLGDIMFMNHNPEGALENWKKALKLDPDNVLLKKKVTHKTFFFE